jgi:lysyl-tRNA synthetase class 2
MLRKRAAVIKQVRTFFDNREYLELDTPLLCADLIPESCLEVFETRRLFPRTGKKESRPLWLIPSPEIWMKKIIARHRVNVYQICKCFRNGESSGHLHSSEFTMLEYYTMNADYMDSLALTEELFEFLYREPYEYEHARDARRKEGLIFNRITVAQAFEKYAGFDLFESAQQGANAMALNARRLGLDPMPGLETAQLYDLIFIHSVEPQLKNGRPAALIDYPAFVPCLAKLSADGRTYERWELYWNGIELANCFSEETDSKRVKDFFINESAAKEKTALVRHNVDNDYWKLFENGGFPRCSGVALGLDRLIMALTGRSTIDSVLPFEAS